MERRMLTAAVAAALLAWPVPAAGQEAETGEGHLSHPAHDAAAHVRHLQEALGLTDAQTARVRTIVTDVLGRQRALHEEALGRVSEVLDEEQRTKLRALHEEAMTRHGGDAAAGAGQAAGEGHHAGPGHDPAAHARHLQERLGLTEAQAGRLRTVLEEVHRRHEALHEDAMGRLSGVLTPEQQAKLEALHREMTRHHGPGHGGGHGVGHGEDGGVR